MTTLYLDRRHCALKITGRTLAIDVDGARETTVPLHLLERLVLRGNVTVESAVLARLAAAGVAVVLFGGRLGRHQASVLGEPHNDGARRIGQIRAYDDPAFRQRFARRLVLGKLRGQRRLLADLLAGRPDQRHALTKAVAALDQALARLRTEPELGIDTLRGIEGAAAAAFFAGLAHALPPALGFTGRNRRPPRDPVNAALSLGYSLLHADAVQAVHAAGLDPMVGFFHELDFGRASLASDLIEPLRPAVERWVWQCFRDGELRAEHFSRDGDACLLGKTGRAHYFGAFERFARVPRRWLRRCAGKLAGVLAARGNPRPTLLEDRP